MSGRSTEKVVDQSAEWLQVATWFLSRQRKIKDINSGIGRCGLRSPYVLQVSSGIIIDSKKSSPYDSRNGASASAGHPVRTHVRNINSTGAMRVLKVGKIFHMTQVVEHLAAAALWYHRLFSPCRFHRALLPEAFQDASPLADSDNFNLPTQH